MSIRAPASARTMDTMTTREQAAANALASVRLEGLDPGRAEHVLNLWARGEITDDQLEQIKQRTIAGQSIDDLLPESGSGQ
jgi:Antitoxin VbhA